VFRVLLGQAERDTDEWWNVSDHGKVTVSLAFSNLPLLGYSEYTHLNGARLGTPSVASDEMSAMGRGTMADVRIL
jgi:hypothetical protein